MDTTIWYEGCLTRTGHKAGPDNQLRQDALLVKTPDRLKEPSILTSKQNCLYGHKGQIFYFFDNCLGFNSEPHKGNTTNLY